MSERPYSRYTREQTWAALYSQHLNAGYALVPFSRLSNSIVVISLPASTPDLAKVTQELSNNLLAASDELEDFYSKRLTPDNYPSILAEASKRIRTAVVLAKSSDYYRYHLDDYPDFKLVICGLHDSYLHIPTWETRSNKRYKARLTAVAIGSPDFEQIRATQYGHNILVGALVCGDAAAITFRDTKLPARTKRRIITEVDDLQNKHYQGRPLAFMTEAKRQEIGAKISAGLKKYHENKHLHAV